MIRLALFVLNQISHLFVTLTSEYGFTTLDLARIADGVNSCVVDIPSSQFNITLASFVEQY